MTKLQFAYDDWRESNVSRGLHIQDAFMAGAAAMAEIFASGSALVQYEKPRKYRVMFGMDHADKERCTFDVIAYESAEAVSIANRRLIAKYPHMGTALYFKLEDTFVSVEPIEEIA